MSVVTVWSDLSRLCGTFQHRLFCEHLKGIVQPKRKIRSYPQVVPNVVWRFLKLTVAESIDVHSTEKNTMEVNGDHQLFGYQHSSKYLLLCSIVLMIRLTRNDIRVSKWWQHSSLGELLLKWCINRKLVYLIIRSEKEWKMFFGTTKLD